jgi:hypothetical protein
MKVGELLTKKIINYGCTLDVVVIPNCTIVK